MNRREASEENKTCDMSQRDVSDVWQELGRAYWTMYLWIQWPDDSG